MGMNPLVVILVYMLVENAKPSRESSVIFPVLTLNDMSLYYSLDKTHKIFLHVMGLDLTRSSVSEVDYIIFVMPFSLSMACLYVILFRCISVGELTVESPWDSELVCGDTSVFSYDIAYHKESLCMNISLIVASHTKQSVTTLFYSTLSLTLVEMYFVSSSRTHESSALEQQVNIFVVILFMLVLLPVTLSFQACSLGLVAGIFFILCSVLVSLGHYSCFGNAQATHVVVLRLAVSIVASTMHFIILAVGRNHVCVEKMFSDI